MGCNNMDDFDKIEKLRQRANVSYSEAGDALRACNGDLLDAMVYLERLGKVRGPEQPSFSTDSQEKTSYENVPEVVVRSQTENTDPSFGSQLGHLLKTAFQKSLDNYLVVSHKNEEKFRIPILVLILAFLFFNIAALIAVIISLFFDVRYSFVGKDDLSSVNRVMEQAGSKATEWMHESYAKQQAKEAQQKEAQQREARQREEAAFRAAKKNEDTKNDTKNSSESIRPKTFAEKEVEDLVRKYDEEDKKNK